MVIRRSRPKLLKPLTEYLTLALTSTLTVAAAADVAKPLEITAPTKPASSALGCFLNIYTSKYFFN